MVPTEIQNNLVIQVTDIKESVDLGGLALSGQVHLQQTDVLGFVSLRPKAGYRTKVGQVLIEKAPLQGNLDFRGAEVAGELAVLESEVKGVLYLGESLPEDGPERRLTEVGRNPKAKLRWMPSVQDVNEIPSEGRDLILVADVQGTLHFRISRRAESSGGSR